MEIYRKYIVWELSLLIANRDLLKDFMKLVLFMYPKDVRRSMPFLMAGSISIISVKNM